ncbi:MAG: M48 family metalloprotease [Spirochaetota bacterium]
MGAKISQAALGAIRSPAGTYIRALSALPGYTRFISMTDVERSSISTREILKGRLLDAKPVNEKRYGHIYTMVRTIADMFGIAMPELWVSRRAYEDAPGMRNCFAFIHKKITAVQFTKELLADDVSIDEMRAAVGHEIGHIVYHAAELDTWIKAFVQKLFNEDEQYLTEEERRLIKNADDPVWHCIFLANIISQMDEMNADRIAVLASQDPAIPADWVIANDPHSSVKRRDGLTPEMDDLDMSHPHPLIRKKCMELFFDSDVCRSAGLGVGRYTIDEVNAAVLEMLPIRLFRDSFEVTGLMGG